MSVAAALSIEMFSVWPRSAPIWNCLPVKEPSMTFMPLKVVFTAMRLISATSWRASAVMLPRSEPVLVSLADWTASSRIRCSMFDTSTCALSVVSSMFLPSDALRMAWLMPMTCAVIFSAMAMPAASSLAALIRRPEESRVIAALKSSVTLAMFACAAMAPMFVLIVVMVPAS